jgi:hypothetical protein
LRKAFAELDRIPLPAEADWVPSRRSGPDATRAFVALALAALVVTTAVLALRAREAPFERELVPAAPPPATPTATPSASPAVPVVPPGFRTGTRRVAGGVYENVAGTRRPLTRVPVNVWVDVGFGGYSLWWALGHSIMSDANGRFDLADLGDAMYFFWAGAPGYVQPTAAVVDLRSDATVDIELVPETAVSATPLAPAFSGVTLSGVVFEFVDGVRRPVVGAHVFIECAPDVLMADTVTDENGRYRVFGIPPRRVGVFVEPTELARVGIDVMTADTNVDLEVKRGP